jgi:hypothetical protein
MKNYTAAQARKFFETKTVTFAEGDIQVDRRKATRTDVSRIIWIDNRTVHRAYPEFPTVYPIALDEHQVYIVCPFCQSYHVHGNDKGKYAGHRVSHCFDGRGYYIEEPIPGNGDNTDNTDNGCNGDNGDNGNNDNNNGNDNG